MRRGETTLRELVVRSLAAAGLVYALVAAYAVPANVFSSDTRTSGVAERDQADDTSPRWRPALARRFPGCVDIAVWDGPGVPGAVVVVTRAGQFRQTSFEDAYQRVRSDNGADDVWVLGACR